jgi:uridine phosphorylase
MGHVWQRWRLKPSRLPAIFSWLGLVLAANEKPDFYYSKEKRMSFPNFPNKHRLKALLDPQDIVSYRRHLGRLPKIDLPAGVLFCLEKGMPKRMQRKVPVRLAGSMLGELYQVKRAKNVAVMSNFGGGAPILVELAEELIVMGTRRVIALTWGGALQPELNSGDIIVCDRAIRDEGTSYHYLAPEKYVQADQELAKSLVEAIRRYGGFASIGCTWTTDAPYRETFEEVRQYQQEGVKTVEMESAGLFALGKARDIQTASAVVIMDRLADLKWEVPDRLDRISKSLEIVYQASIDVLKAY